MKLKWRRYGRNAVLIEFAAKPGRWAFHRSRAIVQALGETPHPRVIEIVPGQTNLLVEFDPGADEPLDQLAAEISQRIERSGRIKTRPGRLHKIPVHYAGPDIKRIAEYNKIPESRVVKYHTSPTYTVYMMGFSPGFAYLGELHKKLRTPRLASPRLQVPAGSVAIGGEYTGIYPIATPGGWNVIGLTEAKLFDPNRADVGAEESAFLLKPGDRVQFYAI